MTELVPTNIGVVAACVRPYFVFLAVRHESQTRVSIPIPGSGPETGINNDRYPAGATTRLAVFSGVDESLPLTVLLFEVDRRLCGHVFARRLTCERDVDLSEIRVDQVDSAD